MKKTVHYTCDNGTIERWTIEYPTDQTPRSTLIDVIACHINDYHSQQGIIAVIDEIWQGGIVGHKTLLWWRCYGYKADYDKLTDKGFKRLHNDIQKVCKLRKQRG